MFDDNDDSDCEIKFKTNNEYAKNYNKWRQKEHFNGLRAKYGESSEDDDSSTTDDDDDEVEFPENVEKDFLKTLASLRNKDPKIYDDKVKFFDDTPIDPTVKKKKKDQGMFLKDYERKMLLEHADGFDEYNDEDCKQKLSGSLTYVEEQEQIKSNLKNQLAKLDDDDDGGLFQTRVKTKVEQEKEDLEYKQWLKGQKDTLDNPDDEANLKPLKEYWNDPNLDTGEKFLRDYILNNRFKEGSDPNYVPTYEEVVHDDEDFADDESNVEKQEEFEHKFNYRFEEPDQEFLKRFPRTIENSLRKTDDRRKVKRQELRERKLREKEEQMEDIRKMKELKRQEIEEKLRKLKEITGNTDVAFQDNDIDDDFDPEAHDRRMQALFNDEFYHGEEGDEKPEFPDMDEELEIERWDRNYKDQLIDDTYEPHAEDEDFNMDCDYDPSTSTQNELIENSKGKKKRKRKSKFAKAVSDPKPLFNPNDKTYEEYLDEYYKLDCEDVISGIPCRFKYRKVTPNSFGLTVDEILRANDKELNRWCSIKKAMQYRPDHVEKYDQIAYSKKAQNEALKRKILPSLYQEENTEIACSTSKEPENNKTKTKKSKADDLKVEESSNSIETKKKSRKVKEIVTSADVAEESISNEVTTKKKKQKKDISINIVESVEVDAVSEPQEEKPKSQKKKNKLKTVQEDTVNTDSKIKKGKNKKKKAQKESQNCEFSDARLQAFGIKPKKFKNKLKYGTNKTN